jgi:hypothetical protein
MDDEREDGLNEEFAIDCGDNDDSIDWLEHFKTDAPPLNLNFYRATDAHTGRLTQELFSKKLSQCLSVSVVSKFPAGLMSALLTMGVQHRQQCDAHNEFLKSINGGEFKRALRFVQEEHERVSLISELLKMQQPPSFPWQSRVPRQMFEWEKVWMGSLRELVRRIEGQLRHCETTLVEQQHYWLNLGRTNIETHLLELALSTIVKQLKEHNIRFDRYWMLVAYAHAISLVPYTESDDRDSSVAAMKMRIARVRKSKNKTAMLGLFLAQLLQEPIS